jgi:hypothetical protein
MTTTNPVHKASCLCGETQFEVHGPLRPVIACHCTQCRKQTGHYLASTSAAVTDLRMLKDQRVRWYQSSKAARRAFCADCGSTLFWQEEARRDRMSIAAGLFDGPTGLTTEGHIFCADKGDYYVLPDEGYQRAQWE